MRITARRDEVAEVVAVLNQQHADAETCAKEVIKLVAEQLQHRDMVVAVHTWDSESAHPINFGPFGSSAEATSFLDKIAIGGEGRIAKLVGPGGLLANADGKKNSKGYCGQDVCGHAAWTHEIAGNSRGGCVLPTCRCAGWKG